MNWLTSRLADKKELQGSVQNETIISRREQEQGSYTRERGWVTVGPLSSGGGRVSQVDSLIVLTGCFLMDWFKALISGKATL